MVSIAAKMTNTSEDIEENLESCATSEKNESICDFQLETAVPTSERRLSFLDFLTEIAIPKTTESLKDENERENISKGCISWQILKVVIFITCLTMFLMQSTEFYLHYFTYPVTTSLDVLKREKFKMPAITICNRNPFPRSQFCSNYTSYCETPNNLEEFCEKHPLICKRNVSDLKLPKLGYYTSQPTEDILEFLHNSSQEVRISDKDDDFLISVIDYRNNELKGTSAIDIVLAEDSSIEPKRYAKCYSVNLHLTDDEDREIWPTDHPDLHYKFYFKQQSWDVFSPWIESQVYFSIQNSFVPLNPLQEGESLEPGYFYSIQVRLGEANLLPHPYQTNCADYEALWRENDRTGPRSQEMCKELCYLSYDRYCFGCEMSPVLIEIPENLCPLNPQPIAQDYYCLNRSEGLKDILHCTRKCEKDCYKLKYDYTLTKMESKTSLDKDDDIIGFFVFVKDTDTVVLNYNPLYGTWELFGYIGGLVGCWLGISVWALVGIMEKFSQKVVRFLQKLRKENQEV